jgi:hypothetical protein
MLQSLLLGTPFKLNTVNAFLVHGDKTPTFQSGGPNSIPILFMSNLHGQGSNMADCFYLTLPIIVPSLRHIHISPLFMYMISLKNHQVIIITTRSWGFSFIPTFYRSQSTRKMTVTIVGEPSPSIKPVLGSLTGNRLAKGG